VLSYRDMLLRFIICATLLIAAVIQPGGYASYCINNNRVTLAEDNDDHCDIQAEAGYPHTDAGCECFDHSPTHYHCSMPMICIGTQDGRHHDNQGYAAASKLTCADSPDAGNTVGYSPRHSLEVSAHHVPIVLSTHLDSTILLI